MGGLVFGSMMMRLREALLGDLVSKQRTPKTRKSRAKDVASQML